MKKRNSPLPYMANRKSPLRAVKVGNISTGATTTNSAVDKLVGKTGDYTMKNALKTMGKVGKGLGKLSTGVGALMFLKDAYKSGQEHSGGRYGYEKNPNYDPNKESSGRHGDKGTNAEFIPSKNPFTGKEREHTDFWSDAKKTTKNNKTTTPKKNKGFNFNKKTDYGV